MIGIVKIKVSALNVRTGASTSYKDIGTVKDNEIFNVISSKNGWYQIEFRDGTGWISNSGNKYGDFTRCVSMDGYARVTASALNVRTGPATSFKRLGTVKKNDKLDIDGKVGEWYKVQYNGKIGFIHGGYATYEKKPVVDSKQGKVYGEFYYVEHGDSLWAIAKRFNTSVSKIKQANNLKSNVIYSNQKLLIPSLLPKHKHTVVKGDTLWELSRKYNTTVEELKKENKLKSDILSIGQVLVIPTSGAAEKVESNPIRKETIDAPDWDVKLLTNTSNFSSKKINVNYVVIHWTANESNGADNDAHYRYFNGGYRGANAHIFVDEDGILQILPLNGYGWHAGKKSMNLQSVGIEVCVNKDGDFNKAYKNSVYATAKVLKEFNLPISRLIRHFDVTGKHCPSYFVDDYRAKEYFNTTAAKAYATFRNDVNEILKGL